MAKPRKYQLAEHWTMKSDEGRRKTGRQTMIKKMECIYDCKSYSFHFAPIPIAPRLHGQQGDRWTKEGSEWYQVAPSRIFKVVVSSSQHSIHEATYLRTDLGYTSIYNKTWPCYRTEKLPNASSWRSGLSRRMKRNTESSNVICWVALLLPFRNVSRISEYRFISILRRLWFRRLWSNNGQCWWSPAAKATRTSATSLHSKGQFQMSQHRSQVKYTYSICHRPCRMIKAAGVHASVFSIWFMLQSWHWSGHARNWLLRSLPACYSRQPILLSSPCCPSLDLRKSQRQQGRIACCGAPNVTTNLVTLRRQIAYNLGPDLVFDGIYCAGEIVLCWVLMWLPAASINQRTDLSWHVYSKMLSEWSNKTI